MKRIIPLMLGMLCSMVGTAQTVRLIDKTTAQPIANVQLSSVKPEASAVSNIKGEVDISAFVGSETILIEHVSYLPMMFTYNQLKAMGAQIALSERVFSMDEVVISASKFEEKSRDVAQQIHVIKSKELAFINQPTTADVLQNSGQVLVQKSQLGGGSPIIRGFETNKVLIVVDGVRMNNAIYRGGHLQNVITLDNSMLDKVEVLFGPGSVVYGSDALGGVMHFYSKNPTLSTDESTTVKANALLRYSSAMQENTGHVNFSIGTKRFGSITSLTYSNFDDLRQGNLRNPFYGNWGMREFYVERINNKDSMIVNPNVNVQKQSGYKQYDVLQKFIFQPSEKVSHTLNLQYSTSSDIPRYDRLTLMSGNKPRFAQWYYGPQERLFASYTFELKDSTTLYDHMRVILGAQGIEESRHDRRFNSTQLNHRTEQVVVYTLNADFAKKMSEHEVRYGLDSWINTVDSKAYVENINTGGRAALNTRYPDGGSAMQSMAAYVTHAWEINPKLILNDGIRLNAVSLNANWNDTTFFPFPFREVTQNSTAITGNLGLVYMPTKNWRFTLLASSGFRAPNVDDLSKVFESVPGRIIVPNPNVKPERTSNLDLGFSRSWNNQVTLGGTAYYTMYNNALTVLPSTFNGSDSLFFDGQMSRVLTLKNSVEAYIYGFNAFISADVNEYFSISSTVNYTYGRIKTDTTDYPLDHIPPVFGKTALHLKLNKLRGEFFVMYNGAKLSRDYNMIGEDNASYSADPVNGYMPAWMTLNVRAAWQFDKNVQLQVALENLLDQNYRIYASNISAPGRNLIVSLRGNF